MQIGPCEEFIKRKFRAGSSYGTRTILDYFEIASYRKKIYTVSVETVEMAKSAPIRSNQNTQDFLTIDQIKFTSRK